MSKSRHAALTLISIHALRKESDWYLAQTGKDSNISIHALRKESDRWFVIDCISHNVFQSTLSVRRATAQELGQLTRIQISIHALRKESDKHDGRRVLVVRISIHALRKESDPHFGQRA